MGHFLSLVGKSYLAGVKVVRKSVRKIYLSLALLFCLVVSGCGQTTPVKQTVRVCDDTGCSERSTKESNIDYKKIAAKSEEMIALEKLAAKEPKAAYDLALRLFRGDGVTQDSYQSLQWMRKAAERGNLDAQKALGRFYLTGLEEMGSDPAEAEKWLMIAAGRGDKESEQLLVEASAAKQNEQAYYQWKTRWRGVFYGYWYRSYRYLGYWRSGIWYYY